MNWLQLCIMLHHVAALLDPDGNYCYFISLCLVLESPVIQGSIHPGHFPIPTAQTPAPTTRNSSPSVFVPVNNVTHVKSQDNITVPEKYGKASRQQTNQTLSSSSVQSNETVTHNTNVGQLQDKHTHAVTGNRLVGT